MRQNLHLYIGDMEVEFNQPPDILYTYQTTELTNPTVIKNSFSKQITIYGSPQNNNIFGQYWDVERLQGTSNGIGAYFNPSKKVPFTLYINGDIYESGYVKLDEVKIVEGKSIEYNITLYGGLGQFFYNLSTDWNTGNKRTLADLNYYEWSESTEPLDLSFIINKDTVASAWTSINSNDVYSVINFAPVYAGIPDNLDADKVVMNFNNLMAFPSATTKDDKTYTTSNGYALATLPQKLMSEEVRDYRSYLQTPVIRVKNVLEAICRPENNSGLYDNGYEVDLDSDFFNTTNPYYWDSWMTLPLLANLEFDYSGGTPTAYTGSFTTAYTANGYIYTFPLSAATTASNTTVKISFDLGVVCPGTPQSNLYMYYTRLKGRGTRVYYRNAYGIQLYASNTLSTSLENILAGSDVKWLTGEQKYDYQDAVNTNQYRKKYNNSNIETIIGNFVNVPSSVQYVFNKRIELTCDLPVGSTCFKIQIARCNVLNNSEKNMLFTSTSPNSGEKREATLLPFRTLPSDDKSVTLQEADEGSSYSNRYISKQMLLGTEFSPADFLLSYCKQFGLYIYKDRVEDKIYIKTRENFYHRDKVIDIQDKIDRLKDIYVKPLNIDYGFFSLSNTAENSKFENDYTQKYGKIYGQKIIATGYDFNADTKDLISSSFKGAVQAKEMSQYFYRPLADIHPYPFNGMKYTLYEDGNYESGTTDVAVNIFEIPQYFNPYNSEFPGYDLVSKPIFYDATKKPLNTEYVMLFFNGYEYVGNFNWNLTDDIGAMYKLNNNPCWLLTVESADTNGNVIAKPIEQFPKFSRWYEGNKWMIYSWDFGSPRELYVPDMTNNDEGNIYYNYFKTYYEDAYDVNSKVVEAYVINTDFKEEDLRYFYWFDNAIWRLNKIEDYNVTSFDGTKCQFIKVQDINNYTNEEATTELWIKVELDKYVLPQSGGTIVGTVKTSDNGPWNIEGYEISPSGDTAFTVTIEPSGGGQNGNFFVTVSANDSNEPKEVTIYFTAGDIGTSVTFVVEGYYIRLIPSAINFCKNGGVATIDVESNIDWNVNISGATPPTPTGATLTGISLDNVVLLTDVPATGVPQTGYTVNSADCTYTITGYYDDNTTQDLTNIADCFGTTTVYTGDNTGARRQVGTLTLQAYYQELFDYETVTIYQEAGSSPGLDYLTIDVISGGALYFKTDNRSYTKNIEISFDNGENWVTKTSSTGNTGSIVVNDGDKVLIRGNNTSYSTAYNHNFLSALTGTLFNLKGNIMSLIGGDNFSGLTSLSDDYAFYKFFSGNTGLLDASELLLPATSLTTGCYEMMFKGCTSLTSAPDLPSATLADECYYWMFYGCSNLNSIKCLATDISAANCTYYWVDGVSANGTFIKNPSMTSWTTGASGIPSGWTVQDNT